jgi:hypothetical protein
MTVHACVAARIVAPGRALARAAAALVRQFEGARCVLHGGAPCPRSPPTPRPPSAPSRSESQTRQRSCLRRGRRVGASGQPDHWLEPGCVAARRTASQAARARASALRAASAAGAHPLRAQPAARRRGGLRRVKRCRSDEQLSAHYASETGGGGARPGASCRRCRASGRHACGAAVGARRASFQPKVCCPAVAARALAGSKGGAAAPRHHATRASRATHPPGARPGPQHGRQRRTRGQPPRAP